MNITTFANFNGPLSLRAESSNPAISVALDKQSVNPPPGQTAVANITISVDAAALAGTNTYTIIGTDPNGVEKSTEASVTVIAPDFSVLVTPVSKTIDAGETTSYTIQLESFVGLQVLLH